MALVLALFLGCGFGGFGFLHVGFRGRREFLRGLFVCLNEWICSFFLLIQSRNRHE